MATLKQNVATIKAAVNTMKSKLDLPATATLAEVTEKVGHVEPKLQSKTLYPSDQADATVKPDSNYDGLSQVTVKQINAGMISGLKADIIKRGEKVLNIVGTYGPTSQTKTVNATSSGVVVVPDGDIEFLSKVTINPVTSVVDSNIAPNNIRDGVTILGIKGAFTGDYTFQENKTAYGSTHDKVTVYPDEGFHSMKTVTIGKITSDIDANIQSANIKKGIKILGVEGTYEPAPSQTQKRVSASTGEVTVYPDEGYGTMDKVIINPVTASIDSSIQSYNIRKNVNILGVTGSMEPTVNQDITITPLKNGQTFYPDANYSGFGKITIEPVTSVADENIISSNIKEGITILGVEGAYNGGNKLQTKTVTPNAQVQEITADDGYDSLVKVTVEATPTETVTIHPTGQDQVIRRSSDKYIDEVTVTKVSSSVDPNIQPENIKMNMSILGVVGTYNGGISDYFGSIPAGDSSSPGIAGAILQIPEEVAFSSTSAAYAFRNCKGLTTVPNIDFSNITNMDYCFSGCTGIKDWSTFVFPSSATSANYPFEKCTMSDNDYYFNVPNLKSIKGLINGSKWSSNNKSTVTVKIGPACTDCSGFASSMSSNYGPKKIILESDEEVICDMNAFAQANPYVDEIIIGEKIKPTNLTRFNNFNSFSAGSIKYWEVNLSECTQMKDGFWQSYTPEHIKFLGESRKLTNMYRFFYVDTYSSESWAKMHTIEGQMYGDSLVDLRQAFHNQYGLINFNGLKNLGKAYTQQTEGYNYYTLDLSACSKLTYASLMAIIDGLYDLNLTYNVANGGTLYRQNLKIGSTNMAKLTAEEIGIATAKGWNVS